MVVDLHKNLDEAKSLRLKDQIRSIGNIHLFLKIIMYQAILLNLNLLF